MPDESKKVVYLDIDKILVPEERVTSVVSDETMRELEESIKERGILQPLYIMQIKDQYVLVDGLHRLIVAKKLGIKKVPCLIKKGTEKDLLIENLIVNRQRGASDPVGEALVLQTLIKEHKMSISAAARELKISESTARKYLSILKLPQEVKDLIRRKLLSLECAYWISKLEDQNLQREVASDAVQYGYTADMCRARVLQLTRPDISAEETGYTFTPAGAPEKVLPKCQLCKKEIESGGTYLWFHDQCAEVVLQALEYLREQEEKEQEQAVPAGTPPPQPQPIYNIQQPVPPQPVQYNIQSPPQQQQQQYNIQQEWIWIDDKHILNLRTKEIRRVIP